MYEVYKVGKRLLVVDDEPDVRLLVSAILKAEGFEVSEAANGPDAVKLLKEEKVDIVLLDIMMPLMDGLHTAHEIRKFSDVPIIIVSVKDDATTVSMAKKLYKVDGFIKKPFHNANLISMVKKTLGVR